MSREADRFRRWWLAVWLALVTHPLLDVMTVYGTQFAQPFSEHPYGIGSIFIIDPLYTRALAIGLAGALALRGDWHVGRITISDLRMGQEPFHPFTFAVARRDNPRLVSFGPQRADARADAEGALRWIARRIVDPPQPPVRQDAGS